MYFSPYFPPTFLTTLFLVNFAFAHRILFYAPGYGGSHVLFHLRLADAIARGGHEVTTLEPEYETDPATFKMPTLAKRTIVSGLFDTNLRIELRDEFAEKAIFTRSSISLVGAYIFLTGYLQRIPEMCEKLVLRNDVLDELRKQKFDAIIYEPFGLCGTGIGHLLGVKTHMLVNSLTMPEFASDLMGLPWMSSHVPATLISDWGDHLSYWERVRNLIAVELDRRAFADKGTTQMFRRHFGSDFPDLFELARDSVAMCFVNSNGLTDFPRPSQSNIIQIGGIGLEDLSDKNNKNESLGDPWDTEMAKGRDGVILVSFGTHVPTSRMPPAFRKHLLEAISSVPNCHFVMKIDREQDNTMKAMASEIPNLFVTTWLPQAKILAHPRLRLFVSHVGFNSLSESAYHGVPVVAVPFFADQFKNSLLPVRNGWGIRVDKKTLFESHRPLMDAINKILSDPRYQHAAQRTRRLFHALPLTAEQQLHRNLHLLLEAGEGQLPEWQSAGRHMDVISFYNLDILVPVLLAGQLLLYLITKMLFAVFGRMAGRR